MNQLVSSLRLLSAHPRLGQGQIICGAHVTGDMSSVQDDQSGFWMGAAKGHFRTVDAARPHPTATWRKHT